ncbi:GP41 [Diatraea saccharalis granulovirus]|uniref:GP41 n=1 Tax=Diatraea saccharalis granulovirus TaxID=1675862 RepID=A0A0R7EYX3_9BBAC|nr:GP41 [Diatraea saccharalis granulovirus]AKN80778.1 GP41 [Diatraea saccharalis granulovirus]
MDILKWNTVVNMIDLYRNNNVSKLTPEQIACMNLVRDIFIQADPVSVNVNKRFNTDEELIEYYGNLEKKYNGTIKLNGSHGVFDKSFVLSPIMKAYADSFYKRRLSLAANHLSDVLKYQMATAITQNKPLPLLNNDTTHEYIQTLYQKADVADNVQQSIDTKSNDRLLLCTDTLNNLVEDVLMGTHNGYYVNTCLYPKLKSAVHRFRNNITFLLKTPLSLSTNIFELIEQKALDNGQELDIDYSELIEKKSSIPNKQLTELAFENEALRRGKIQELNIKYSDLLK